MSLERGPMLGHANSPGHGVEVGAAATLPCDALAGWGPGVVHEVSRTVATTAAAIIFVTQTSVLLDSAIVRRTTSRPTGLT